MIRHYYDFREERLFLIAYIFWLLNAGIGLTLWNKFELIYTVGNYLKNISYVLLIILFLIKHNYTKRDILGVFSIIICCILSDLQIYYKYIISAIIWIYFSANIEFRKILKCTFIIQIWLLTVTVVAAYTGILENEIWSNELGRNRYGLGYLYCAYPAHILLFMTLIWFYLKKKFCVLETVCILGVNTFIYYVTDSRADYYICILAICGFYVISAMKKKRIIKRIMKVLTKYSCGVLAVFSILAHYFYNSQNEIMQKMNVLLSNRLKLGFNAINEYGFSLFGNAIRWVGMGSIKSNPATVYNYVDCSFLKEILSYGIVFLIILILAFSFVGDQIVKEEDYFLGWTVFISLVYSVFNAHLCWLTFNVFILVLGRIFKTTGQDKIYI